MLKDLKVSDYQNFIEVSKDMKKDEDITIAMYKCMVSEDLPSYKDILLSVNGLAKEIANANADFNPIIKVNDVELGFIPDLENITFDEVMDLDSYMNDVSNHHKLMAILYRPITDVKGKKYRVTDYTGTHYSAERMKNLPLKHYFAAMGFFARLGMDLQNAFPSYSQTQKEVATT